MSATRKNPGWTIGLVGMVMACCGGGAAWLVSRHPDLELLGRTDWPALLLVGAAAGLVVAAAGVALYARGDSEG